MAQEEVATDRLRSWVVAACCCFCNFTFYGVSRLSGIMLVAATQTFDVSRASAAVPFSLSTAIRNLAGVFVGHLGHRFGVGPVVAAGCLIASLGSGLCYFAKDMQWLTVCWGGMFGIGFGLSTCLLPLAINQNFVKHNGTASGISYSGSYLGSFIFPPVVVWLLNSYGLQGTFLVISGAILNVLVAAILLKEPKTTKKCVLNSSSKDSFCSDSYVSSKGINVIYKDNEMWKQNLNRAFLDSQCSLRDKNDQLNFKSNIPLVNQPYLRQKYMSLKQENENASKFNSNLHSQFSINHHNFTPNLFRNFKFNLNGDFLNEDLKKGDESSSSQITLLHVSPLKRKDSINSHFKYSSVFLVASKQVPEVPKMHFRKVLESKLLSKSKYKVKYKLKLQKLKKVIISSLLKNRVLNEGCMQSDNVKLTSFKPTQSFLCPNSYNISLLNKHFYLTKSHSVQDGQSSTVENVETNVSSNSSVNLQEDSKRKIPFPSSETYNTKDVINALIVINGSWEENKNSDSPSVNNHTKNRTTNCDVFAEGQQDSSGIPTAKNYDDISSNKSSIYDDSSSSYKTADDPSSYVPSFSSELSLQDTSKSRDSKNSSGNRSRSSTKAVKRYFSDLFYMLRKPMFAVIGITMSIQTFTVVCVVTTIEDFAKDVGIAENRTHYALMALSISNLIGTLTLGTITDRGFISRHRFLSVCFFGMSLSLIALSLLAVSLPTLLSLLTIYGLLESGVIITFPILTKQFVKGERRQAVAIASSNVLSAPTVMLVPMLIGYFRDNIGSYSGLFHLLGATSFTCSVLWLVAPSICQRRRLRKAIEQIVTKC